MRKNQRLAIAALCCVVLTVVRVFFIAVFFITSVICIVIAESHVERCDGHVTLYQIAVDSLNTTSTFVETVVSSFLIFLIYRWKQFKERADKLLYLYRAILFTYGLRMLALFLYDSFLVARNITRQSEYRELDSVLLALDVGYRGSLAVFFFRKFFDFAVPQVFEETNSKSNSQVKSERMEEEKEITLELGQTL
ncbi:hypothetical protein P5673_005088 [Acropora cervicornis]|uniref:Uncharacterized protein n=1 Tax=Acropora cervicornis TaxID=6130 RepID=A0AAD9QZJ7_ACRCE|nr:hypothetical protein P5673_005088 [Acropora cervicornis]